MILAVALGLVAPAAAQDEGNSSCGVQTIFPSAQRDLMFGQAATDNTNLYGAVGTAERVVLPAMHKHEGMGMMVFEQHVLAGATEVAVTSNSDCSRDVFRSPVDLTSSNWALAWSGEDVGVFYNAAVTNAYGAGSGALRGVYGTVSTLAGIYYGLAAPFIPTGTQSNEVSIVTFDWIAGAEVTPGTVAIRAGYVGSRGAYFQAAESRSGAFVGLAANESFAELPYARGGLERLAIPKVVDKIGRVSLFGRKLVLPGVVADQQDVTESNFFTGHLAQEGIAEIVDVWATYAVTPTPFFHELRVGGHTPNFLGLDDDDEGWGFRGTAGFVTMPQRIDLDVEGGRRFSGSLEAAYHLGERDEFGIIEFSLRYNDPKVLALFPYAEDALDIYFMLSFGGT